MSLTFFGLLHLPQLDVEITGALRAQQQQEELQQSSHPRQPEQQRPQLVVAKEKVQTQDLELGRHVGKQGEVSK